MKSIQAYNILYFSHRSRYDGTNKESCLQYGQAPQEYVGSARQMASILSVPTDAHLLHGLAVPAFLCSLA